MKPLFSPQGQRALSRLSPETSLLAFDFDGTLAPLVVRPGDAALTPQFMGLLKPLSEVFKVALVSGRAEANLRRRVGGLEVWAAVGNHGSEGTRGDARYRQAARRWRRALEPTLRELPGLVLEDKGTSLTIHFRGASSAARRQLRAALSALPDAKVVPGKRVLNVISPDAPTKAHALLALMRRARLPQALFIGDDVTDEDVFEGVPRDTVLGVHVGRNKSAAEFYVPSQASVARALTLLVERHCRSAT